MVSRCRALLLSKKYALRLIRLQSHPPKLADLITGLSPTVRLGHAVFPQHYRRSSLSGHHAIADIGDLCLRYRMSQIEPYAAEHFDGVKALWEEVFPNDPPWNRAEIVIPGKLNVQPELFLVAMSDTRVVGTAMAGYDGHRGWLYTIAVHPDFRRSGIGSRLLEEAEARLNGMGCAKINLQIRAGNEGVSSFYTRHGYQVEDRISMGKRIGG